ncbi:MAG: UvrD-helicase domain-containing protein [Chitinispirillaceae bacterium]|nr:UvrD-helicase domain-containing protein [Chitinispirillaceae bacterium]
MEFIADLHIHSRFSRATSRDCCPEKLDLWARRKGVNLLGTGDFTHRAWRAELEGKLSPAGNGFYTLKSQFRENDDFPDAEVQFVLSGEISSIYKKNGRTRKVHNVILLPSLDAAEKLSIRLETVGNLHSDGRPILGLDSKTLLDMTLSVCPEAIFIPAHIWTPHFSVLGANSGFDSIDECFEDLTGSIYAVETGLSSDPFMNWRLSALDRFALVSNSDAHSPPNLAREANVFDTDSTYDALYAALKNNDRKAFLGTIEFFPEEGKYHFDGHRSCNIQWEPSKTIAANGLCPVCGRKLTVGVLHRVEELADRPEGFTPKRSRGFVRMTTLPHIIAASFGCGAASRRVTACYDVMLGKLGPELSILRTVALDDIKSAAGALIAEGVRRVREGDLYISPGYDGEYGVIEIFSDAERREFLGQAALFETASVTKRGTRRKQTIKKKPALHKAAATPETTEAITHALNEPQLRAVTAGNGAVMVIAGPGTGKTRTLVSRITYLIAERHINPATITAVTFTNKAAAEMRERLRHLLSADAVRLLTTGTFHSICLTLLRDQAPSEPPPVIVDEAAARAIVRELLNECPSSYTASRFLRDVSLAKSFMRPVSQLLDGKAFMLYEAYRQKLDAYGTLDFDDLLLRALDLTDRPGISPALTGRFSHLLVDEFQDINEVQYALVKRWSRLTGTLFVIGDPHQAIYGFRGASPRFFGEFRRDFPEATEIALTQNYRSPVAIVESAKSVIAQSPAAATHPALFNATFESDCPIRLVTARNEFSEAVFIAKEINRIVGGVDMIDAHRFSGRKDDDGVTRGFSDIVVLYRTHRQAEVLERCLIQEGIAFRVAGRDKSLSEPPVAGMLSIIKFVLNPGDVFSLTAALRYCGESVDYATKYAAGDRTIDRLSGLMGESRLAIDPPGKFVASVGTLRSNIGKQSPRETIAALGELLGTADNEPVRRLLHIAELHDDPRSFLHTVTLGGEADILRNGRGRPHGDAVLLCTLHAAKGLEFPVVFICGVNDGLLPLRNAEGETADIDEERRLFYVGITRAREELILTAADRRSVFGEVGQCGKSMFVSDMDQRYIVQEIYRPEPVVEQMSLL